ncbi:hypothetical protein [Verrucosispora sp. WMMC514]|uniref:hypothetical protein n=1 Tax=Verrucosispora sp. WMMC514 TaxID=3015156 RepID=UPI00248C84CA|nr:hypothetical protein [Verrucosispora sp. WMMC514]WBB94114.1 hypothetical protein O7597_14795 [Verrucosispora sp. WMMC514]
MTATDDMWAAARQLGEAIAAQRAADRQAKKDARNARRRSRYRANPPSRGPKASAVIVDDEPELEPGCRCAVVASPPCPWCEGGGGDDE